MRTLSTNTFPSWRPTDGRILNSPFAFDCETTRINESCPWIAPAFVLGAAHDGTHSVFVERPHLWSFLEAHADCELIFHNAAFDLSVINTVDPSRDVYTRVDEHRVWCTLLLHRLYALGHAGHVSPGKGRSTLEHCADHYLGEGLSKDLVDSQGQPVRINYGQWLGRPLDDIEPVYLDYLAQDARVTYDVYIELTRRLADLLEGSHDTFGYVSDDWLAEQVARWGWQTHHIQLQADIVLRQIQAVGLQVDRDQRDVALARVEQVIEASREQLQKYGFIPGQKGSQKALQEIMRGLEREHPEYTFPRTATGKYMTSYEALQGLVDTDPFVKALFEFKQAEKLKSTYLNKMGPAVLHPSFNVLVRSGRTTSYGEINAQILPRNNQIRGCFVPPPGDVFIDADYATMELATLAQAVMSQFDLPSEMAAAINRGDDLHRMVAARFTGKDAADVTPDERQKAKPLNFGKPGGMGSRTLQQYAKTSYGVDLGEEEVERLSQSWFELFPEMEDFLTEDRDSGQQVAELLDLTPVTYFEHTGSRKFLDHEANWHKEHQPNSVLGFMCLRTLCEERPQTRVGKDYDDDEIDYFWEQAEAATALLSKPLAKAVRERRPSVALKLAVRRVADRGRAITLTGRLRAEAGYTARHNSLFQGLAADGAKLALWLLWRAGYRIVNFIHDEVLVAVPADSNLGRHAETVRYLMQAGLRMVVPDVTVAVEYAVTDRWAKSGKVVLDDHGRIGVHEVYGQHV